MLHKSINLYSSTSGLLVTNWLSFPIQLKCQIDNKKQWVVPNRPDLLFRPQNIEKQMVLDSHSSVYTPPIIKPTNSPHMLGNLGKFKLRINSDLYGPIKIAGAQVNAYGVTTYDLFFGLYKIRHRAGLNYNIYEIMGRGTIDNSNWMKQLLIKKNNIKINQLVMPGSHDSGMIINRFSFLKRLTENQYEDIFGQLMAGIRYFDLRFTIKHRKFHIYHGNKYIAETGITLKSLITDINLFLKYHGRQETIFFVISRTRSQLKEEDRSMLALKLMTEINNTATKSDISSDSLAEEQLRNLKGKVVILFDKKDFKKLNSQYLTINQIQGDYLKEQESKCLTVYNKYANTNMIEDMIIDQNKKLAKFGGLGRKYLFLYSFTMTVQSQFRLSLQHYSIQLLGNISRSRLPIQLQKMKKGTLQKPNIVYYDFIDSWSCRAIIQLNY